MRELLESATERAIHYLEGLDDRPVAPDPAAVAELEHLSHRPLPGALGSEQRGARPLGERVVQPLACSPRTARGSRSPSRSSRARV
ncbi:MAG: hypothetical protein EXR95_02870 [Gemmatimonadetes bacterium]|nr:hypothetical protein [Gemmatimonadota bacterium]